MGSETFLEVILAILLPPVGVFLRYGSLLTTDASKTVNGLPKSLTSGRDSFCASDDVSVKPPDPTSFGSRLSDGDSAIGLRDKAVDRLPPASMLSISGLTAEKVDEDDPEATLSKELLGEAIEDDLTEEFGDIAVLLLVFLLILDPLVLMDALLVIDPDKERLIALEVLLDLVVVVVSEGDLRAVSLELSTNFGEPPFIFLETTADFRVTALPAKPTLE
ncbi:hypothetical protein GW17_00000088 [Ensete ventricosum]|nr:hypothetical protein GW17_00000088 [Ensete ventricosum]